MTLLHTLDLGVSGMQTQSHRIYVISQNVSNLDTVGYKDERAEFASLVGNPIANSIDTGGARVNDSQAADLQGEITDTQQPTDLAISGNGFFAVRGDSSSTGGFYYTREGSFVRDQDGNLKNGAGYYLQGWPYDANGNLSPMTAGALKPVNVSELDGTVTPTSEMALKLNLKAGQPAYAGPPAYSAASSSANMASGAIAPQFTEALSIIDSDGNAHTVNAGFLKTGDNSWAVELYAAKPSDVSGNAQLASGTITFNGDGTLANVSSSLSTVSAAWSNGDSNSVAFNWGTAGPVFGTPGATVIGRTDGLSQYDGDYTVQDISQDGVQQGTLQGVAFSSGGHLTATYSNGSTRNLCVVAVAKFINPNQLEAISGTTFTTTVQNGAVDFLVPGQGGAGILQPSALEHSNADEQTELSNLIIAQRAYQFNSSVLSHTDDMLQKLTEMLG